MHQLAPSATTGLPRPKQEPLAPKTLQGFKYFRLIDDLLVRLRNDGTERDKAGNRDLFFDQYATLLPLDFFNPTVTSLQGLQKFTTLEKVHRAAKMHVAFGVFEQVPVDVSVTHGNASELKEFNSSSSRAGSTWPTLRGRPGLREQCPVSGV